jgi:hypothetical protein
MISQYSDIVGTCKDEMNPYTPAILCAMSIFHPHVFAVISLFFGVPNPCRSHWISIGNSSSEVVTFSTRGGTSGNCGIWARSVGG